MKVVIFTEDKVGEGHYQAAKAISHALGELSSGQVETNIVCGLRCIHPAVEWIIVKTYFAMIHYIPSLWDFMYTHLRRPSFFQRVVFSWKLKRWLEREQPDMILCTHPTCIAALARLKSTSPFSFKLGMVLTDFCFHPFGVSPYVDYYFVPHHSIKERLVQEFDIHPHKIFDFGIPVHPAYEEQVKGARPKAAGGALSPDKPIHLLILGGAMGIGPIADIMEQFRDRISQFKLTIICGKNRSLYNKLSRCAAPHIEVLGYVTNMAEWIQKADVVISKPGGLTVAETLVCRTPLLMISPIPGQEHGNRLYLEQYGLSRCIENIEDLPRTVLEWLEDEQARLEWEERVREHRKEQAAYHIARQVLSYIFP
ncbi:processive 1,2-diacylglycerol beta-glucosyltransferase [Caldalkalibacillus uzonensis]|uniref:Processive 1,2-diacylglycerol beta-glucosyltransferase n=1 Tax=Caldalkalibacillus uzonensis TaxID=353224 RepID=A0ABU0CTM8_9BACI|nr:glycosyltransferase [Caldalkalibacillus uzonensis]MDQ0339773.1 processive 1,2-diacylglycerol beta-glucosyltransferase [Caldalkalibacillus uzonensis]